MYCPHCGKPVPDGANFCGECGKNLLEFTSESGNRKLDAGTMSEKKGQKRQKKACRKIPIPLIAGLTAVIVGFVAGAAALSYLRSQNEEAEQTTPALESDAEAEDSASEETDVSLKGASDSGTAEKDKNSEHSDTSGEAAETVTDISLGEAVETVTEQEYNPYDFSDLNLTVWDGTVAESYAGGDGSKKDPYQISNGAELAYFAECVKHGQGNDAYYILTADIQMNELDGWDDWLDTPPENVFAGAGKQTYSGTAYYFCGDFDGQDHVIYGLYSENGLFNSVRYGGDIANVHLAACVTYGDEHSGGLIGEIYNGSGASDVVIDNCSFYGIVQGETVGGIVGYVDLSSTSCLIQSCRVSSSITGQKYAGGIAGSVSGKVNSGSNESFRVKYCYNHSSVFAQTAGGIAGALLTEGSSTGFSHYVSSCANTGSITTSAESASGISRAGGIAGDISASPGYISITKSSSSGEILKYGDTNTTVYRGGVVGEYFTSTGGTVRLSNCVYLKGISAYSAASNAAQFYGDFSTNLLESMTLKEMDSAGYPVCTDAETALRSGSFVEAGGKIVYEGVFGQLFVAEADGGRETLICYLGSRSTELEEKYWVSWLIESDYVIYYGAVGSDGSIGLRMFNLLTGEDIPVATPVGDFAMLGSENGLVYYSDQTCVDDPAPYTACLDPETGTVTTVLETASELLQNGYLFTQALDPDASSGYICIFYDLEGTQISSVHVEKSGNIEVSNGEVMILENQTIYLFDPWTGTRTAVCSYTGEGALYDIDDTYIYTVVSLTEILTDEDENMYDALIYRVDRQTGDVEFYETEFFP